MLRMGIFSVDECAADDLRVLILFRRPAKITVIESSQFQIC